jgi:hypothetical protein
VEPLFYFISCACAEMKMKKKKSLGEVGPDQ